MVLLVMLLAGCGPAGSGPSALPTAGAATTAGPTGAAPTGTPASTPSVVATRLDEVLTLADGRTIRARCVGEGSPTILLEVGGSGNMADWTAQFVNDLGAATTTCLYSRAGGDGSSAPAKTPVSMAAVTSDAYEVLALAKAKADIEGPYVFVGWALGGPVALANALAHPDETVGLAILDTDFPADFLKSCQADGREKADCTAEYNGDIDAKFMEREIAQAVHQLDLPAVLITAMQYPDCVDVPSATLSTNIEGRTVVAADCAGLAAAVADKQIADWKTVLPQIVQTRIEANHDGMVRSDRRQIVQLILQMIAATKAD